MARVELTTVSKVYPGGVKAVDGINLSIPDREFIVLVGPSGCGKSTTLRMIAGLEEISGGTISIGDRVVNNVAPKDRDIAMVFQNYALYPHMSVYKNMAFGLKLRGFPKVEIDRRVREAAKILDIGHLLERKPKALSGGQRQRVAVGRAIVREPAAFLFDEPLSNLDAKLRVETRAQIKRLHQRLQTTTIYVTHDQEEAMTLGDRIVVMRDGLIQQSDTPLVTYHQPLNRFVAGFIGMPPMNFFDGRLSQDGGELVFTEGKTTRNDEDKVARRDELTMSGGGFKLTLPPQKAEMVASQAGQHVVLGMRPEHFALSEHEFDDDTTVGRIEVTLTVAEPLGSDMDIYMTTELNDHVVGRVEARQNLKFNQKVTVFVNLDKLHVFEPGETGANLTVGELAEVGVA